MAQTAASAEPRGRLTEAFHGTLKQLSALHNDAVQAFQGTLSQLSILHEKEVQALQLQVSQLRRHLNQARQGSFEHEAQGTPSTCTARGADSSKVHSEEPDLGDADWAGPLTGQPLDQRVPHFKACWWIRGDHGGGPGSRDVPGDAPDQPPDQVDRDEATEAPYPPTWARTPLGTASPSYNWVTSGSARPSGSQASTMSPHKSQVRLSNCVQHAETIKKEMEQCEVPAVRRMRRFRRRIKDSMRVSSRGRWLACIGLVEHPVFDFLCAVMIVLNSVIIGCDVAWNTAHGYDNFYYTMVGHACSAFFLLELLLRIALHGCRKLFCLEGWGWNLFDLILVIFSAVDIIVISFHEDIGTIGRGMKTVKMLRIVRVFRVFRFCREMSLLVLMIIDSMKSLMWAIVLVAIIMYVFAIWFTQAALVFESDSPSSVEEYFGTLDQTIYTLLQASLGGVSWGVVSDSLLTIHWGLALLFFFYIAFTILAVLNIITGVFVDNAVETAQTQREFLVQKEMELKERYIGEMKSLFCEMDKDGNGTVTVQEVEDFLQDKRIMSYFQALGLDPQDTERLFRLIDEDESGGISIDEFLSGCLRLKGQARSIDIHALLFDLKKLVSKFERMEVMVKKSFGPMPSLSGISTHTLLRAATSAITKV